MIAVQAPAAAQDVSGWRLTETAHVLLYTIDGTAGARDGPRVAAALEEVAGSIIAALPRSPVRIVYPLYPTVERFGEDWWRFATLSHGDLVHAWGAVYAGDAPLISPYEVTRALVLSAFPGGLAFLRWGVADALGDRAAGVDAHRHVRALEAAGQALPRPEEILASSDFGDALPFSYPVAVSFVAFLMETYGMPRTVVFVDRVSFRYYEFPALFAAHFGVSLDDAVRAWKARTAAAPVSRIDVRSYARAAQFVYRIGLARTPSRIMLESYGAEIVTEAFRATVALRRLDVDAAMRHLDVAQGVEERAERRSRLRTGAVRGLLALLVVTPVLLAIGWLVWPSVRGRIADARRRKAVGRKQ